MYRHYHHLSKEYSKPNGDKNDDIAPVICTPGKLNTNLSYQVNSHNVGHSSNYSAHGEGGITSESAEDYWEYLFKVVSDDAGHVADSSLKQSATATPSSDDFAECINYNSVNGEQYNGHVRTEVMLKLCFHVIKVYENVTIYFLIKKNGYRYLGHGNMIILKFHNALLWQTVEFCSTTPQLQVC